MGNSDVFRIEFYPSIESYVHVSQKFHAKASRHKVAQIAYQAFVMLNGIIFPAYLLFNDRYVWALGIFLVTLIIWGAIMPRVIGQANASYFTNLLGDVTKHRSVLEADLWGVKCMHKDNTYAVPWKNITEIEETHDVIFFFFGHNGMFVAKSGFGADDEAKRFLRFARSMVGEARTG